jgi:hypothetical protein
MRKMLKAINRDVTKVELVIWKREHLIPWFVC